MVFCGYLRTNECCILFFNRLFEGILKCFISIWFISSKIGYFYLFKAFSTASIKFVRGYLFGFNIIEVFTVDELKKTIEGAKNEDPMWRALISCFIDTGARRGEIVALRWTDVDLFSGRVEIFNNAQYVEGIGIYDTTPKSGKPRVIYLNEQTITALK